MNVLLEPGAEALAGGAGDRGGRVVRREFVMRPLQVLPREGPEILAPPEELRSARHSGEKPSARDAADQRAPMTDSQTMPADPMSAEAIPDEVAIQATKQATADVQTFADFSMLAASRRPIPRHM